jgi:hypothetical protein
MKTNRKQDPQAAKNEAIYNLIADHARRAFELLTIEPGEHTAADVAKAIKKHRAFFTEEFYKLPEFVEIEHDGFTCSFRLSDIFTILSKCATAWRIRTAARVTFVREEEEEQPANVAAVVADTLTTDTATANTPEPATAPAAVAGWNNKIIICSIPRPATVAADDSTDDTTGDHLTPDEIRALVTAERKRLADTINTDTNPDAPAFAVGESFELLTDTGATVAARVRSQYYNNDDDTAAPCWLYLCDCDPWTDRHGVTIDGGTYDAARMRKTAAPAADGYQDTTDDATATTSEPATVAATVAWLRPLLQYAAAAFIGIFAALLLLITPERAQQATANTIEPATVAAAVADTLTTDTATATASEPATVAATVADTLTTDTATATTIEPATVAAVVADTLTTDAATATTSEPATVANDDTTGESSEPATVANDDTSDDDTTTATDDNSDNSDDNGATSGPTTANGATTTTTTPGQPTPATTSGPATVAAAAAGL